MGGEGGVGYLQGGVGYMAEQVELNEILRGKDGKRMFPLQGVLESQVGARSSASAAVQLEALYTGVHCPTPTRRRAGRGPVYPWGRG